jgi:GNAT superfamily N-acetyltransferase
VFAGLSPHSRLLRFHAPVPRLTASWCRLLTAVDGRRHAAIVAEAFVDGRWAAVGIARIAATGPGTAELAFAVVDAWHGRGIGGRLVDEAACLAVDLGHERLTALVLRENARARALLRSRFPDATVTGRGAAQEFLIPLPTMSLAPTGALEYTRGALAVDRRNQSRALVRSQTSGRPAAVCA